MHEQIMFEFVEGQLLFKALGTFFLGFSTLGNLDIKLTDTTRVAPHEVACIILFFSNCERLGEIS